ncbi:MAG: hypothetical protein D6741_12390, partial [Planctomycetota bacterium]
MSFRLSFPTTAVDARSFGSPLRRAVYGASVERDAIQASSEKPPAYSSDAGGRSIGGTDGAPSAGLSSLM